MADLFFYGTLCHAPLLERVMGQGAAARAAPAKLADHEVRWADGQPFPLIQQKEGAIAPGVFLQGVTPAEQARLDFYEGKYSYALHPVTVETATGHAAAQVYFPEPGRWPAGEEWSLLDWVRDWGDLIVETASEIMDYHGKLTPDEVSRRLPMIRVRAASRVRARISAPTSLRARFGASDLQEVQARRPYSNYFTLEEHDLAFRRFGGDMSETVNRAGLNLGDAVTVLPFDPARDRVLVIEQFRFGPHLRGDPHPWVLEPIAGRIDGGEDPETCARREAMEEANLPIGRLEHIADYYPSPGAVGEFLMSYVGLCDLPDTAVRIGGMDHEAEDIRAHVISFDRLQELVTTGEAECGPLVLSALWLGQNRARLRAAS